jgi:hypothetical protein
LVPGFEIEEVVSEDGDDLNLKGVIHQEHRRELFIAIEVSVCGQRLIEAQVITKSESS